MDSMHNFLKREPRYARLSKPLEAAKVCGEVRKLADGRFDAISFKAGLLTLASPSPSAAANLRMETYQLQKKINEVLGEELVKKIRIKIQ